MKIPNDVLQQALEKISIAACMLFKYLLCASNVVIFKNMKVENITKNLPRPDTLTCKCFKWIKFKKII